MARNDFQRAESLHKSGKAHQAERILSGLLAAEPTHAPALHLLGLISAEAGQPLVGAALIGRALQLNGPVADWCIHLGTILEHEKNLTGAAWSFRQALDVRPKDSTTAFRLGNVLTRCGHLDEAGSRYEQAIAARPGFAEAWFNLGVVRAMRSQTREAVTAYRRAIELKPTYAEALNNLGTLLHAMGHLDSAISSYQEALRVSPSYTQALYNLGLARQTQNHLEEARSLYESVLRDEPGHLEARNNLGNILLALNQPAAAAANYRAVLRADQGHAEASWNLGVCQLLQGELREGWQGYEWRFRQGRVQRRHATKPAWKGDELNGRRLLIWAEQGFGDSIQMIRFAQFAALRGGRVTVECQPRLVPLFDGVRGVDQVVAIGDSLPEFDCQIAMMSLPGALGVDLSSLPNEPYLKPTGAMRDSWRARLSQHPAPHVGLVWAGNPQHPNDRNRSIEPAALNPLFELPVSYFTLQPDVAAPDGVHSLAAHLSDFTETAAAVSNLDLVITVDTSVAHLAGAIGAPVWTLLPFAPDWRWLLDRDDSPWYPSMRLFRQTAQGDWPGVLGRVREALARQLASARPSRRANSARH